MADSITVRHTEPSMSKSTIACHMCRKRKIKCGRELPKCSVCQLSSQQCEYPEKALRPGPKIGSQQSSRKRHALDSDGNPSQPKARRESTSSLATNNHTRELPSNRRPLSPDTSASSGSPKQANPSIQSLSFIIHPSHESCSPEEQDDATPKSNGHNHPDNNFSSCCYALGLDPEQVNQLISRFFENFTSFPLFRERDLRSKLEFSTTSTQTIAMLASMLAFATKIDDDQAGTDGDSPMYTGSPYFSNLARKYIELAIQECEDGPLPLPLLQALILHTNWLLIQGVRGRAWRYLGTAIRSAYELNLHLIDSGKGSETDKSDPSQWCEDEERRRAWWAIWEMDVFASTIRRCPTGIDWSQNETFLPAEDEMWERGEPQRSCILEQDLGQRWKTLEATKNKSPKAWFIVINSLMKDAQKITSPIGVNKISSPNTQRAINSNDFRPRPENPGAKEALNRLWTIHNALHCTMMALPKSLKFQNQYLDFGCRETDCTRAAARRLLHSSIYSIHVMIELTKLMIYKYYIFRTGMKWPLTIQEPNNLSSQMTDDARSHNSMNSGNTVITGESRTQALDAYSQASTEIVLLIRHSFEDHHRYVNPFLANTIWLAGAVQLLYREMAPLSPADRDLTNSNFDVLSMTYDRFVSHWNMSTTLQKNLQRVEVELQELGLDSRKAERFRRGGPSSHARGDQASRRPSSSKENHANTATGPLSDMTRPENTPSTAFIRPDNNSLTGLQTEFVDSQNNLWSRAARHPQPQNEPAQYVAMQQQPQQPIIVAGTGSAQEQQQQAPPSQDPNTRSSAGGGGGGGGASSFFGSPSALPAMSQPSGQNIGFQESSSSSAMPVFATPESDPTMGPDFLDSMSFGRDPLAANDIDLSSYLDEILSYQCMA